MNGTGTLLAGRRAVVTGAARGLGEAMAKEGQIAFDRLQARQQEHIRQIRDTVRQMGEGLGLEALTPLEQAVARITRTYEEAANRVQKLRAELAEVA